MLKQTKFIYQSTQGQKIFTQNVYKINCNDCSASYVGQTKRQLGTRINEHRNKY